MGDTGFIFHFTFLFWCYIHNVWNIFGWICEFVQCQKILCGYFGWNTDGITSDWYVLKFLFIKFPQCEFKMFHYQEIIWDDQLSWSVLHTDDVISKFKMIWHWVEICWKHGNIAIQCSCVILLNMVQSKCTLLECAKVVHFYCWNMSNSTYQKEAGVTPCVKFWKSVWRCLKILLCVL